MRATILATLAALAAMSSPAYAEPVETLVYFKRSDLEKGLKEAGATLTPATDKSERVEFTFEDGVFADALLLACDDKKKNCLGTSLLATFSPAEGGTPEQVNEAINNYNYRENFGRAYLDPDGTISVRMYIIADGGITRENYSRQIGLWFRSVVDFFGYLYPEEGASGDAAKENVPEKKGV